MLAADVTRRGSHSAELKVGAVLVSFYELSRSGGMIE